MAACSHTGRASVRWVLSTLLRVDFGLPSCRIVVGIPHWFRAGEACELFPQHTWTLWSCFADLVPLLSHCHSRPSRLCHILPPETVQSMRTAVMPGSHSDPKCSSSLAAPSGIQLSSSFHAPQGDSGETSLLCGGWGTLRIIKTFFCHYLSSEVSLNVCQDMLWGCVLKDL